MDFKGNLKNFEFKLKFLKKFKKIFRKLWIFKGIYKKLYIFWYKLNQGLENLYIFREILKSLSEIIKF